MLASVDMGDGAKSRAKPRRVFAADRGGDVAIAIGLELEEARIFAPGRQGSHWQEDDVNSGASSSGSCDQRLATGMLQRETGTGAAAARGIVAAGRNSGASSVRGTLAAELWWGPEH